MCSFSLWKCTHFHWNACIFTEKCAHFQTKDLTRLGNSFILCILFRLLRELSRRIIFFSFFSFSFFFFFSSRKLEIGNQLFKLVTYWSLLVFFFFCLVLRWLVTILRGLWYPCFGLCRIRVDPSLPAIFLLVCNDPQSWQPNQDSNWGPLAY